VAACQFSNDVESKLAKFLQLIGTVKRTIFRKVRTETILKIYNNLVLLTFLHGSENWTLTALQRHLCEAVRVQFSEPYKNVGKTGVFYIFKIVSILTFLKIVKKVNSN